jgi:hypothetical protein
MDEQVMFVYFVNNAVLFIDFSAHFTSQLVF